MRTQFSARLSAALLLAALAAAPSHAQQPTRSDSAALVTVLGRDTLVLERWVRTGNTINAEAVVRTPRTTVRRYRMELGPDGNMRRFEEQVFDPANLQRPVRTDVVEAGTGGWTRTTTQGDSTRTSRIEADSRALPFGDLVSWPMDLVAQRAVRGATSQPLITGNRAADFALARPAADRVIITHPLRGPSAVRVDPAGRLLMLDAAGTTRQVVVTRVPWLELDARARQWAAADQAGRSLGELSGRGELDTEVAGARIAVDYGTPSKRGRDIFGNVVPWGQVWRTGANRATQFKTDKTLVLGTPATGTITVPAGSYSLFSIPTETGGQLIVNRQTNQPGTAHDAAQDLGRVAMQRRTLPEPVERFTIEAVPLDGRRGELRLVWDRSAFVVPFVVQD